ncbi:tail protein X [Parasalinivibrio latis]|uniref:tail protein X n=1 Tax=Parasalinivibrio latis TaxID=2952610 RepID=UPI0030E576DD
MKALTVQGDVLDAVIWRHLGSQPGLVEQVLEANPGLAGLGPVLPAGLMIELPVPTLPTEPVRVQLWD